ncbi:uncharacterized protein FMAN_13876 [Fusarium mangiferae]|uniref:DUF6546 domain-containing protein n=1 Tax=Fusarium mangiferae TaxID=192010 RepID=A0A1L7TBH8_FUSMA|nr:uncharacterized protein FMAN_13876 [Fusarium mangiferae]CVK95954.1 uncharacterized protein FMAN_13876 [Fusarium mangiferae]
MSHSHCIHFIQTSVQSATPQATRNTAVIGTTTTWNRLPREIQHYILGFLAHQYRRKHVYASVCQEWRTFMEERTFHNLMVYQHGLTSLAQLSAQPRAAIHHLWFNMELQGPVCHECFAANTRQMPTINSAVAQLMRLPEYYLYQLFSTMSSWDCTERGLTLEFNAYSVREQAHWLKNWFIGCPGESQRIPVLTIDPSHDWRTVALASVVSTIATCFRPIRLNNDMKLPLADAVTKFVIRRYYRNRFRPSDIARLVKACPRLVHLHLETWAHSDAKFITSRNSNIRQEYDLIANIHPSTLRTLTVYEDFCIEHLLLAPLFYGPRCVYVEQERWVDENSKQFAAKSLNLEHLSISFVAIAETFFSHCQSDWTWKSLQTVILTTRQFTRDLASKAVSVFLQDAAQVALRMPRLEIIVLWNARRRRRASSFTYRRTKMAATIAWCSTMDVEFDRYTVQAWEEVARKHGHPYLWLEKRRIEGEIISEGHAIRLLELPSLVIDPESRQQMEQEYEVPNIPGVHQTPAVLPRLN